MGTFLAVLGLLVKSLFYVALTVWVLAVVLGIAVMMYILYLLIVQEHYK